jgi:hypothetical protein
MEHRERSFAFPLLQDYSENAAILSYTYIAYPVKYLSKS